jgi:hypothetical protein
VFGARKSKIFASCRKIVACKHEAYKHNVFAASKTKFLIVFAASKFLISTDFSGCKIFNFASSQNSYNFVAAKTMFLQAIKIFEFEATNTKYLSASISEH